MRSCSCLVCLRDLGGVSASYGSYGGAHLHSSLYLHSLLLSNLNASQLCLAYGGSCVTTTACSTVHLYGLYHHSVLTCNSTSSTICCLPLLNFKLLYASRGRSRRRSSSYHRQRGYSNRHRWWHGQKKKHMKSCSSWRFQYFADLQRKW